MRTTVHEPGPRGATRQPTVTPPDPPKPSRLAINDRIETVVAQLLSPCTENRVELAAHLGQLGVDERGSTQPRGSLEKVASSRLPDSDIMALIELLHGADNELRAEVALALGEWGGEDAAAAIAGLLGSDPEESVKEHCVTALGLIGGPAATQALRWAAEHATSGLQGQALAALEELESGGVLDLAEGF